jgi:hypothetical protein
VNGADFVNLVVRFWIGFTGDTGEASETGFGRSDRPDGLTAATTFSFFAGVHGMPEPSNKTGSIGPWVTF